MAQVGEVEKISTGRVPPPLFLIEACELVMTPDVLVLEVTVPFWKRREKKVAWSVWLDF